MTVHIPDELEQSLLQRAQDRRISMEELVREALRWYLQLDSVTLDELSAWEEVRDEAMRLIEESPQ